MSQEPVEFPRDPVEFAELAAPGADLWEWLARGLVLVGFLLLAAAAVQWLRRRRPRPQPRRVERDEFLTWRDSLEHHVDAAAAARIEDWLQRAEVDIPQAATLRRDLQPVRYGGPPLSLEQLRGQIEAVAQAEEVHA